jgi:hypothetical protein
VGGHRLLFWVFTFSSWILLVVGVVVVVSIMRSYIVIVVVSVIVSSPILVVILVPVVRFVLGCPVRTLSIGSQERRRPFLFHDILGESPENDANSTVLIVYIILGQGVDSVLPMNVDIPTKRKYAIVGLGKVQAAVAFVLGRRPQKGQFASRAEADADGNVLSFGALRIKGAEKRRKKKVKKVNR